MATKKKQHTALAVIAVPPDGGKRHVTANRQTALCGVEIPGDWYQGDAGDFGETGDCAACLKELKAEPADEPAEHGEPAEAEEPGA